MKFSVRVDIYIDSLHCISLHSISLKVPAVF